MLTVRLHISALLAVATMCVVFPSAPAAAKDAGGPVDCDRHPTAPGCNVRVGIPGQPSRPGAGGGGSGDAGSADPGRCSYVPALSGGPPPPGAKTPGGWYVQSCVLGGPGVNTVNSEPVWIPDGAAPSPAVLGMEAVARLSLPKPVVQTSPSAAGEVLLRVPVWLWLSAGSWGARSATASVPGLAVTATATPVRVVWRTGDGATVTCAGPGTPWTPGTDPAASSPTCGHVYVRPSAGQPGGVFTMTATVTWNISWAGGGASGTVAPLTTTASVPVRVVESQTVVTG